ncbi:MAG: toxin HigB-2 [Gammaproteobacteria bacterium RIFCSPLOWO2_02_FULL_42_14]|nr:MAG: toxin HigB-2 [Gammaproteobacteria bacterium RIFCSPHIGHO2_02_FULL_42_43]OGT27856.1 MAG: toxin HigB-2 [Gammaproteobacteria bacterium RIFCSPHIGHO2_01_FULL_42_8]OGT51148.1 MAG: toxin HigB-2 [Gammaproteobacteria bacterium RIFCSPHIGHO2_12_FULL_41_25]OGT62910.1 MAG: toxin HigB-2 [Gammaproteobacteria bacterium RIFCSPLOWO2_02_FULL_42_14]OGT86041.1 MAG: toxin HigB-2 [Gammaproteobacteria bacterium RIFCSPLOWO2_12_FULL_42_18]
MILIETTLFTKLLPDYLTDDQYSELQNHIIEKPDAGVVIQDTGGLRKLRWSLNNKGKRGGVRIIYYWQVSDDHIYLMTLYGKNEIENLSVREKRTLKKILAKW